MNNTSWTNDEVVALKTFAKFYAWGRRCARIAVQSGKLDASRTVEAARFKLRALHDELYPLGCRIPESRYPRYDKPLVMEGDALVLPDVEAPFHDADFVQKCVDLAAAWGINQLILAGDFVHFDSLSAWGANWITDEPGTLPDSVGDDLLRFIETLPVEYQQNGLAVLGRIGEASGGTPNLGRELADTRALVGELSKVFKSVVFVLGNHEGRLLRALDSSMFPSDLLELFRAGHWRVSPYYYSLVISAGEAFRITHPKTAAKYAAEKLAAKYHQHIIMAHSHAWRFNIDPSGKFWAIQAGHCVDETRLPYASQRDTPRDAHALGAVIIRNGYPWLLGEKTPFDAMERMA